MLWSSISAFFLSYYHLQIRPEWRDRAPWLSLRNLGFGAESARSVLVELSAHFGASESTFGAPLALLESKDMRFLKVWFLYNLCMRWNRKFSCSGSAYGQVGVIFGRVLDSFFDGCGDLQMTTGAPWSPIGTQGRENRVQRCGRRWNFENFENFYFLIFQFPWSILHIHSRLRPIHSARVGSPLAFYGSSFVIQSCDYFNRFSVNGIQIKIVAGMVKFQYTSKNENWGVHARP